MMAEKWGNVAIKLISHCPPPGCHFEIHPAVPEIKIITHSCFKDHWMLAHCIHWTVFWFHFVRIQFCKWTNPILVLHYTQSRAFFRRPRWTRNYPLSWNRKIHCRVHKSQLLVPVLREINSVRIVPPYYLKANKNLTNQCHVGESFFRNLSSFSWWTNNITSYFISYVLI
jgi:hypothetical protein